MGTLITSCYGAELMTYPETVPSWFLLNLKVVQATWNILYTNQIVYDEILPGQSVVYRVGVLPGPYACPYAYVRTASQPIKSKNSFHISISVQ